MEQQQIDKDLDLPLMSNVDDFRARHYMMKLEFDFGKSEVNGESVIFLQEKHSSEFEDIIFDQRHLDFKAVGALDSQNLSSKVINDFDSRKDFELMSRCFKSDFKPLDFTVEEWCLRIKKPKQYFPKILKITWQTMKGANSLMWRNNQDGHKCAFTAAAAVNNRSLFPCQEPPIAMASWQCLIKASLPNATILCTGDDNGKICDEDGYHYFFTQMILPMSTFAVAISVWKSTILVDSDLSSMTKKNDSICQKLHEDYPCHIDRGDIGPLIPCRLFGPVHLVDQASKTWSIYLEACLKSAHELLGSHPFKKLDIVIVPRCYSGLGLASPNLMFVSQSLVKDDGGMIIRLSHEIAHNWFGLLIGAKDWTEEWLTEVIPFN